MKLSLITLSFLALAVLSACNKKIEGEGASIIDGDTKTIELISPGSNLFVLPESQICSGQVIKYDFEKSQLFVTRCNSSNTLSTSITDFSLLDEKNREYSEDRVKRLIKQLSVESFVSTFEHCPEDFSPNWVRVITKTDEVTHYVKKEESCGTTTPKKDSRIKGVVVFLIKLFRIFYLRLNSIHP